MTKPTIQRLAARVRGLLASIAAEDPPGPAARSSVPKPAKAERRSLPPTREDSQYFHRRAYDGVGGESG